MNTEEPGLRPDCRDACKAGALPAELWPQDLRP